MPSELAQSTGSLWSPRRFDRNVDAPRALHLALASDRQTAALAVGYVRGLKPTRRTRVMGAADGDGTELGWDMGGMAGESRAPVIVVEAMLKVVAAPGDEVTLEELAELALQLRDDVGLPVRWVTAERFTSVAAQQLLWGRGIATGEVAVADEPRGSTNSKDHDRSTCGFRKF